jgi:hypothetical protein
VLAHLLRADLVPEAWAPTERSRDLRVALRERMFYVRLGTMTKNRIVTVFDRYPEQTAQLKKLGDLFGKAGRVQLAEVNVSDIDRIQIDRGLEFIGDINERIKPSESTIRAMTKANANVKRLKTIPGIGEFFARLILCDRSREASGSRIGEWFNAGQITTEARKCWYFAPCVLSLENDHVQNHDRSQGSRKGCLHISVQSRHPGRRRRAHRGVRRRSRTDARQIRGRPPLQGEGGD